MVEGVGGVEVLDGCVAVAVVWIRDEGRAGAVGHVVSGWVNGLTREPRDGSGALVMKAVIAEDGCDGMAGGLLLRVGEVVGDVSAAGGASLRVMNA